MSNKQGTTKKDTTQKDTTQVVSELPYCRYHLKSDGTVEVFGQEPVTLEQKKEISKKFTNAKFVSAYGKRKSAKGVLQYFVDLTTFNKISFRSGTSISALQAQKDSLLEAWASDKITANEYKKQVQAINKLIADKRKK